MTYNPDHAQHSLDELYQAIIRRIERGKAFKELMEEKVHALKTDMTTPVGGDVDGFKQRLVELATILQDASVNPNYNMEPIRTTFGGRRKSRRRSHRRSK
jgi:hypothetical protein